MITFGLNGDEIFYNSDTVFVSQYLFLLEIQLYVFLLEIKLYLFLLEINYIQYYNKIPFLLISIKYHRIKYTYTEIIGCSDIKVQI